MIVRKYPIRTSRDNWEVKFYSKHICSEKCAEITTNIPNTNIYIVQKKIDFIANKCPNYEKIQLSSVKISEFNINEPKSINGELLNTNDIIIPDSRIRIVFGFPLSIPLEAVITANDLNGFTLKNILQSIKTIYDYIYKEEERTASINTYKLTKICSDCMESDFSKYLINCDKVENIECSICCDNTNTEYISLKCEHKFHKKCILEWLNNGSNCPLCRENIKECKLCNGTFVIYYDYVGKVIPIEHRGILLNRNVTDGKFGIYAYDFNDLLLKSINYNRKHKIATLNLTI